MKSVGIAKQFDEEHFRRAEEIIDIYTSLKIAALCGLALYFNYDHVENLCLVSDCI